jgi:tRNA isopentenyl-2-thiomethyl-A-37 hydroxylase MiaE
MNRMNFFELSNSRGRSETRFFDEYFKIAEMMFDDSFKDKLLKFFVAMDCDVSKANHVFNGNGRFFSLIREFR